MEINRLSPGNVIKYNNRFDTIMQQLSYNEYLIDHCGTPIIVNILEIAPIELRDNELKNLGFNKSGKKTDISTQKKITTWSKTIDIDGEESIMSIDMIEDTPELDLADITGVEQHIPDYYKYVHQIQNLFSYITNEMPVYNN
jgi:hypothetical protein